MAVVRFYAPTVVPIVASQCTALPTSEREVDTTKSTKLL
jgi:hypothetical protein